MIQKDYQKDNYMTPHVPRRGERAHFYDQPVIVKHLVPGNHTPSLEDAEDARLYLKDPSAFWNRPDRWDHACPPWEIEAPYQPQLRFYDACTDLTYIVEPADVSR
jgi:hypothetical protein